MSKVGGALPSWYWPAGIPRRVPVAQQPLGRILRQRFTAAAAKPAIVADGRTITYAELSQRAMQLAGGLQASSIIKGPLAIGDSDPAESLVLLLAALFAGRQVFLPSIGADDPAVAAQMAEAKVAALLTSVADAPPRDGLPVLHAVELAGNFNEAASAKRANEPGVLLAGERGVVTHSHFSLSAMAASMAAFIPKLRESAFICTARSLGSWEMLTGMLLALLGGMPVYFDRIDSDSQRSPAYVILDRAQADGIIAENRAPDLVRNASYVFVSTGSFAARWRRKLESLCGAPVFPIWGVPELGPVLASHPTWMPPHGHGFPLVNVSLIPIDPATGRVSIVPWEMLEKAEMGVEALSAMLGYAEASRNAAAKSGTALRTGQIASMDHVGVVVLQDGTNAAGA